MSVINGCVRIQELYASCVHVGTSICHGNGTETHFRAGQVNTVLRLREPPGNWNGRVVCFRIFGCLPIITHTLQLMILLLREPSGRMGTSDSTTPGPMGNGRMLTLHGRDM